MDLGATAKKDLSSIAAPPRLRSARGGDADACTRLRKRIDVDVELTRLVGRVGNRSTVRCEDTVDLVEGRRSIRRFLDAFHLRHDPEIVTRVGGRASDQQKAGIA